MQYLRRLTGLHKVIFWLKLCFKFFLKRSEPTKIMPYEGILQKKIKADEQEVLNYPDHYNWMQEISDPSYSTLLVYPDQTYKNNFSYRNPYFSSDISPRNRFKKSGVFPDQKKHIYSLEDGGILGDYGIVYDTKTRTIVKESVRQYFIPSKYNPFSANLNISEKEVYKGLGILLAHPGSDGGFYHFVLESLGKLSLLRPAKISFDFYFLPGPNLPWKLRWLEFFNIDLSKVVWLNHSSHIEVEQLIFTSPVFPDQKISPFIINYFNYLANNKTEYNIVDTQYPRVWLSRKNLSNRNIAWEDEIAQQFGFAQVDIGELNILDAINLFKNAQTIVGPHGAAFVHLMFCQPETKIIELFPDNEIQPCYQRLCEIAGLSYRAFSLNFNDTSTVKSSGLLNYISSICLTN